MVIIHSRRFASNVVTIVGTSLKEVLAVVLLLKLHVKKIIYFLFLCCVFRRRSEQKSCTFYYLDSYSETSLFLCCIFHP